MEDVHELVPAAHRTIRRLDDPESPYRGALVADGDRQRVRVDAEGVDAALWEFADAEHVAGVRDVLRERQGQGVLLPWCIEPVEVFLGRRAAAERALTAGETVTLAGSLLRGIAEVADRAVPGRWWLDDRCRPLFAPGEGSSCAEAGVALIEQVRGSCADRAMERVLSRICAQARDHRAVLRSLDDWEREMTELAAPRPLDREVHAPERVRAIPLHRAHVSPAGSAADERIPLRERLVLSGRGAVERLREAAEGLRPARRGPRPDRRDAVGRSAVRESGPSPRAPRTRMLMVGGAAAGAVLLGGLLLPGADGPDTGTRAVAVETAAPPADAAPEAGAPPAGSAESATVPQSGTEDAREPASRKEPATVPSQDPDDVQRAARTLLAQLDDCRAESDSACTRAVVAGGGRTVLDRLGQGAADRETDLVDDYGDVAVVRIAAGEGHPEQMLVLERNENGWLVRDVYDVADQPPAGS